MPVIYFTGLWAALSTFFGVWVGHVLVRVIEYRAVSLRLPIIGFALLGAGLLAASVFTANNGLSGALGILGITALWDAFEFTRQQKRIAHGHAPANPNNPRHQRIMQAHPKTATTLDWLDRDPRGAAYTPDELAAIKERAS